MELKKLEPLFQPFDRIFSLDRDLGTISHILSVFLILYTVCNQLQTQYDVARCHILFSFKHGKER